MTVCPRASDDLETAAAAARLRSSLSARMQAYVGGNSERATGLEGLSIASLYAPTPPVAYMYPPSLSLIVSGRKRVRLGDDDYTYDEKNFLLTSVNLPTITEVTDASPGAPYVSLRMTLDVPVVRDFVTRAAITATDAGRGTPLATGPTTVDLLRAVDRLIDIVDDPQALDHLGPLIQQEIVYRILTGSAGARLRDIMIPDSGSYRAAKALAWIRDNYAVQMQVKALASQVGLGVSTLHKHVRQMTGMTPLSYQKQFRLLEARRLLVMDREDAAMVGSRVGYESTSQFSREYRRMFGAPPARNAAEIKARLLARAHGHQKDPTE